MDCNRCCASTPQTLNCFGGFDVGIPTVLEVGETLGEADESVSWLVSVGSTANWMAARCSAQVQQEIFGTNPGARVAGSSTPATARRVGGGLRISGRWPYASGAHHADWALVGASVPGEPDEALLCVVPSAELGLENSWHTVGMRGTGSDTWVGDDVFVPDHRTIPVTAMAEGTWPVPCEEPIYRLPGAPVATVLLLAPLPGLGNAALRFVVDNAAAKALHGTTYSRQSESVGLQIQIAEAAMRIGTARLLAYDIATILDAAAVDKQTVSYADRAEFRARLGYAAQQIIDALSVLMNVHGAGSFAQSNVLQRFWRDANTAARHAGLQPTVGYEVYGKLLLCVGERVSAIV